MRSPTALLTLLLLVAPSVGAQKVAQAPARPLLQPGADTNDARTYYKYGVAMLSEKPAESVKGFYWALQIDPSSAETMYALRTSSLLAMRHDELYDFFDRSSKKRRPEYVALDSLFLRALSVNPFLYRNMDLPLIRAWAEAMVLNGYPSADRAQLDLHVLDEMRAMRKSGWMSFADGRLGDALEAYSKDLTNKGRSKKDHEESDSEIHAARAHVFYQMGNMDSARAELTTAISGFRERDRKDDVLLYESKAVYEHSLGMINEKADKKELAREAYEQALQEDLSYYPAHARLAQLQLVAGDTAGALSEMELAVQLHPNDPILHYAYAIIYVKAKRDADAAAQLKKAATADPYFPAPHFLLARIADVEDDAEDAVPEYRKFVSLAPKSDANLASAKDRLDKLTATMASATAPVSAKP